MDAEATRFLADLTKRVERLEASSRRIQDIYTAGETNRVSIRLAFNLANQCLIRETFLMEALREKGLLEALDMEAIEKKVRARYADDPGYSVKPKWADLNVKVVIGEIVKNEFKQPEDYDPNWGDIPGDR